MSKNCAEKLTDPRWQRKRLEVFSAADWSCEVCGDKESELHAHHQDYRNGAEPWDYPAGWIVCLCSHCHDLAHAPQWKVERYFDKKLHPERVTRSNALASDFIGQAILSLPNEIQDKHAVPLLRVRSELQRIKMLIAA